MKHDPEPRLRSGAQQLRAFVPDLPDVETIVAEAELLRSTATTFAPGRPSRPRARLVAAAAAVTTIGAGAIALIPGNGTPALAYDTEPGTYVYRMTTTGPDGRAHTERVRFMVATRDGRRVVVGSVTLDEQGRPRDGVEFVDEHTIRMWHEGEMDEQRVGEGELVAGTGGALVIEADIPPDPAATPELLEAVPVPDDAAKSGAGRRVSVAGGGATAIGISVGSAMTVAFDDWAWVQPSGPFAGEIPDGIGAGESFDSSPRPPAGLEAIGLPECRTTLTERTGDRFAFHTECTTLAQELGAPAGPAVGVGSGQAAGERDAGEVGFVASAGVVSLEPDGEGDLRVVTPGEDCSIAESTAITDLVIDAELGVVTESATSMRGGGIDCAGRDHDLPSPEMTTRSVLER